MLNIQSNATVKKVLPYVFWVMLAITTWLLLIELAPSQGGIPHADKVVHAFIFLLLSTVGYLAFPNQRTFIMLGLAFYGALSEGLQHLLTVTRHASFLDWFADIFGILLCFFIMHLLNKRSNIPVSQEIT